MQFEKRSHELISRNLECLDVLMKRLTAPPYELHGDEVRELVYKHACQVDLDFLNAERALAL